MNERYEDWSLSLLPFSMDELRLITGMTARHLRLGIEISDLCQLTFGLTHDHLQRHSFYSFWDALQLTLCLDKSTRTNFSLKNISQILDVLYHVLGDRSHEIRAGQKEALVAEVSTSLSETLTTHLENPDGKFQSIGYQSIELFEAVDTFIQRSACCSVLR